MNFRRIKAFIFNEKAETRIYSFDALKFAGADAGALKKHNILLIITGIAATAALSAAAFSKSFQTPLIRIIIALLTVFVVYSFVSEIIKTNKNADKYIPFVKERVSFSAREAAEYFGISENTAKRELKRLFDWDIITLTEDSYATESVDKYTFKGELKQNFDNLMEMNRTKNDD